MSDCDDLPTVITIDGNTLTVRPDPNVKGTSLQFYMVGLTDKMIAERIGFEPNHYEGPEYEEASWTFWLGEFRCGVWRFRGCPAHSACGPIHLMAQIFGKEHMR